MPALVPDKRYLNKSYKRQIVGQTRHLEPLKNWQAIVAKISPKMTQRIAKTFCLPVIRHVPPLKSMSCKDHDITNMRTVGGEGADHQVTSTCQLRASAWAAAKGGAQKVMYFFDFAFVRVCLCVCSCLCASNCVLSPVSESQRSAFARVCLWSFTFVNTSFNFTPFCDIPMSPVAVALVALA